MSAHPFVDLGFRQFMESTYGETTPFFKQDLYKAYVIGLGAAIAGLVGKETIETADLAAISDSYEVNLKIISDDIYNALKELHDDNSR